AWYVLALSLMGLVLGVWLRQSEGRGGRGARPPHRSLFFNKTNKCCGAKQHKQHTHIKKKQPNKTTKKKLFSSFY
ncbi:hypothetical protein, partial [Enterobacter hormaechei]